MSRPTHRDQRAPQPHRNGSTCDNDGTCRKAASSASDKRSLYMKRRVSFIEQAQKAGRVRVVYIKSADNRSDILTKALEAKAFSKLRNLILNVSRSAKGIHAHVQSKPIGVVKSRRKG